MVHILELNLILFKINNILQYFFFVLTIFYNFFRWNNDIIKKKK